MTPKTKDPKHLSRGQQTSRLKPATQTQPTSETHKLTPVVWCQLSTCHSAERDVKELTPATAQSGMLKPPRTHIWCGRSALSQLRARESWYNLSTHRTRVQIDGVPDKTAWSVLGSPGWGAVRDLPPSIHDESERLPSDQESSRSEKPTPRGQASRGHNRTSVTSLLIFRRR